jgi:uncharacterized membrane protein
MKMQFDLLHAALCFCLWLGFVVVVMIVVRLVGCFGRRVCGSAAALFLLFSACIIGTEHAFYCAASSRPNRSAVCRGVQFSDD